MLSAQFEQPGPDLWTKTLRYRTEFDVISMASTEWLHNINNNIIIPFLGCCIH